MQTNTRFTSNDALVMPVLFLLPYIWQLNMMYAKYFGSCFKSQLEYETAATPIRQPGVIRHIKCAQHMHNRSQTHAHSDTHTYTQAHADSHTDTHTLGDKANILYAK